VLAYCYLLAQHTPNRVYPSSFPSPVMYHMRMLHGDLCPTHTYKAVPTHLKSSSLLLDDDKGGYIPHHATSQRLMRLRQRTELGWAGLPAHSTTTIIISLARISEIIGWRGGRGCCYKFTVSLVAIPRTSHLNVTLLPRCTSCHSTGVLSDPHPHRAAQGSVTFTP